MKEKYSVTNFYSKAQGDSILTGMITYMYTTDKFPKADRFLPPHHGFYVSQLSHFSIYKYYKGEDGMEYYYVIRPADNPKGYKRGVGGKLKLDDHQRIVYFEESFVTPMYPENDLKTKGDYLFREFIKEGKIDSFSEMRSYVEWPDGQLKYDQDLHEWTY